MTKSAAYKKRLKDKKIEILGFINTAEPGDMPNEEWSPIHDGKLWAYIRQLSSTEYVAAKQIKSEEEILFVINWRNDITDSMVIKYNGLFYGIRRIDTFEGYKNDLQIYATGGTSEEPGY